MRKKLSPEEFKGWQDALFSVILNSNNNCKQGAFRRILNSVSGYGGREITIVDPRQHVGIKAVEIKTLPASGTKKIEMLKNILMMMSITQE